MRADRPKQYLDLCGRSLLSAPSTVFSTIPRLRGLAVSLAAEDPCGRRWPVPASPHPARPGGRERADSVLGGLLLLSEQGATMATGCWCTIAAAQFLPRRSDRLLANCPGPVGGLLGVPARDTLKRVGRDGR